MQGDSEICLGVCHVGSLKFICCHSDSAKEARAPAIGVSFSVVEGRKGRCCLTEPLWSLVEVAVESAREARLEESADGSCTVASERTVIEQIFLVYHCLKAWFAGS